MSAVYMWMLNEARKGLWSQRMLANKIQLVAISVHTLNLSFLLALFHLDFSTYDAGDWQVTDTCSTAELNAQTLSCQHSMEDVSISMFLCTYKHCKDKHCLYSLQWFASS